VRVGRERDRVAARQVSTRVAGGAPVTAEQRRRVHLEHRARREFAAQPAVVVEHPRRALRMCEHRREAAVAQLVCGHGELLVDAAERRLDQEPAGAWRTVRDRVELALVEPPDHVGPELGADAQGDRDPRRVDMPLELAHALGQVVHARVEVGAHVRGRDHRRRAVAACLLGELEAVLEQRRPVVDPRQDVEVDLGAGSAPRERGVHRCTPSFRWTLRLSRSASVNCLQSALKRCDPGVTSV
jgi:hypothetical protein